MINDINISEDQQFIDTCIFLTSVFRDTKENIEYRLIDKATGVVEQIYGKYDPEMSFIEQYEKLKRSNEGGSDVYISPATRFEEKGNKNSVAEVSCLWADIDCESEEDKTSKRTKIYTDAIRTGLMPTIIIESGRGYHIYFKLKEILHIQNDTNRRAVEGSLRWLAKEFGGDHVTDISRVMRLPGLMNMKDPDNPKQCSIVDIYPSALYDLKNFGTVDNQSEESSKISLGVIPDKIPDRFYNLLAINNKLEVTWACKREDLDDQSRSGHDMALANILCGEGFSMEEAARIMLEAPYKKNRTMRYLEHTLSKVYSETRTFEMVLDTVASETGLSRYSLKKEDFDSTSIEYLIEDFLPFNSNILLTSKYGVGKSILELAVTKKLIMEGYKVVIVDADMSLGVIGSRLEDAGLLEYIDSQLFYFHSSKLPVKIDAKNEEWNTFKESISNEKDLVIFFDTFKDLAPIGADLDHDTAVMPIMNELKSIRNMGHTVIVLHHIGKDGGMNNPFKNSGSIADAVDVAYLLDRKTDDTDLFTLKAFKQRIPVKKELKFVLHPDFSLHSMETQQDIEFYDQMMAVYKYMTKDKGYDCSYLQKDVIEAMKGNISKHKVSAVLRAGESKLWDKTSGDRKSLIYKPIELNSQKSKNLPPYIAKSLGFLDFEE